MNSLSWTASLFLSSFFLQHCLSLLFLRFFCLFLFILENFLDSLSDPVAETFHFCPHLFNVYEFLLVVLKFLFHDCLTLKNINKIWSQRTLVFNALLLPEILLFPPRPLFLFGSSFSACCPHTYDGSWILFIFNSYEGFLCSYVSNSVFR